MPRLIAAAMLVLVIGRVPHLQAQPALERDTAAVSEESLAAIVEPLVQRQLRTQRIAGAVVVAVSEGEVVYRRGFGLADVNRQRIMQTDTPVRLASISKTFTAIAVMQLVEAGTLSLDRDVNAYLDFTLQTSRDGPVTLRRLLSHRAGFESRTGSIASISGDRVPLGRFLRNHIPPYLSDDADTVAYSNYGAAVAAYIVERASGTPFESFLGERIFRPLGMIHSTAEQPPPARLLPMIALGYARSDIPPTATSMGSEVIQEAGSTGVIASGDDMGHFMLALLDPPEGWLRRTSLQEMMREGGPAPNGFMGLGFYSPVAAGGQTFVGHDGGTGGFHNTLALAPHQRFGIFVSYNTAGIRRSVSAEGELLREIAAHLLPPDRPVAPLGPRTDAVDGVYQPTRRADSNLFRVTALLEQIAIESVGADEVALNLAIVPFGGIRLPKRAPGLFRDGQGLELAVAATESRSEAQIGAPPARYVRVPWWLSARTVFPPVAVALVVALFTTGALTWRICRPRMAVDDALERRVTIASRLALLFDLLAIAASVWLVTSGAPSVATGSAFVTPLVLGIYTAAWLGVGLAPVSVYRAVRVWRGRRRSWVAVSGATLTALAALVLSAFCVVWHIAGTTLAFL